MNKSKNNNADSEDLKKKLKPTQEEILNGINLKSIEKESLDRVFLLLSELQDQPSSDEDNKQKKYLMEIEKKANQKKMKMIIKTGSNNGSKNGSPKKEKKYKEDDSKGSPGNSASTIDDHKNKIGVKAIRKVLKKLEQEVPKDEIHLMIWVFFLIKIFLKFFF